MSRPLFTPVQNPVPTVQEAGWVPGPVRTGAENLAPTGVRSPDRPDRNQSLHRLSYRVHVVITVDILYKIMAPQDKLSLLYLLYTDGQIKKNEREEACNTYGAEERCI